MNTQFFIFNLLSQENIVDCARLEEEAKRWEQCITQDENKQAQAERTLKFWSDCPAKVSVSYRS